VREGRPREVRQKIFALLTKSEYKSLADEASLQTKL
jgi:hypothetical protein